MLILEKKQTPAANSLFCVDIDGVRKDPTFATIDLARAFADLHPSSHAEIWGPGDEAGDMCPRCWLRRGPQGAWADQKN